MGSMAAIFDEVNAADPVEETPVAVETSETEAPSLDPGTGDKPATEVTPVESVAGDARTLPAWIKNMKAVDPEGYNAAKDTWFERASWKEKFAGGTKEADELLGFLGEHGGREGLTQALADLNGKAQELDAIAEKMQNGDPSLLADFVASSPEGFTKLAPAMLAEWSKTDFDGYNAQLSGIFARTIAESAIPRALDLTAIHMDILSDALVAAGLQDNPAVVRAYRGIADQIGEVKKFAGTFSQAQQASPVKTADTSKLDAREQAIRQSEQEFQAKTFDDEIEKLKVPEMEKELKPWVAKAPGDEEKREAAVAMLRDRVTQALRQEQKDKGKSSTASQTAALLQKGDRTGALRIVRTREAVLIRDLAPKVGRIIYGPGESPKVAPKPEAVAARAVPKPTPTGRRSQFADVWAETMG